jgi:hypothetical protein
MSAAQRIAGQETLTRTEHGLLLRAADHDTLPELADLRLARSRLAHLLGQGTQA